jgi:hypothetical protein
MTLQKFKWDTVELFDPESLVFEGNGAKHEASEIALGQRDLLNFIVRRALEYGRDIPAITSVGNYFFEAFGGALATSVRVVSAQNGSFIVESPYPVLTHQRVVDWDNRIRSEIARVTRAETRNLAWFILGALGFFQYRSSEAPGAIEPGSFPPQISGMMEFSAMLTHRLAFTEATSERAQRLKRLHDDAEKAVEKIGIERVAHEEFIKVLKEKLAEVDTASDLLTAKVSKVSKSNREQSSHFTQLLQQQRAEFEATLTQAQTAAEQSLLDHSAQISDRLNLRLVTQRWHDVRKRAKRTLWASGIAIFLMFVLASAIIARHGHEILDFLMPFDLKTMYLNTTATGVLSMQIARMALVAVPIATYFWLLKIIVRIFMRSLVLMDDADQRATIMDSYYALTGDGMTDERALPMMLWAIFRPLPGHGPDGIEPPDFTEAINAGLKIGSK